MVSVEEMAYNTAEIYFQLYFMCNLFIGTLSNLQDAENGVEGDEGSRRGV